MTVTDRPTFRGGRRPVIPLWTAPEVWRLRTAKRMSVRAFAAWLGVSDRMVSKWESGTVPGPINQEALDTALRLCTADEIRRFRALPERPPRQRTSEVEPAPVAEPATVPLGQPPPAELWEDETMRRALRHHDLAYVFHVLQRHGLSQRRIAALVGMSQSEISEIMAGRRVGQYGVLERVAVGLAVPRHPMGLSSNEDAHADVR